MQKYFDFILRRNGTAVSGASVTVNQHPGGSKATIYSDDGVTETANPLTTDDNGYFEFYAADGSYTLVISGSDLTTTSIEDIELQEHDTGLDDIASLTPTDGNIIVGDGTDWVAESGGTARSSLGLVIGTDVQAHSSVLDNTTASYTTAEETKLAGIEDNADVTDATNVEAAGALMDSDLGSNGGDVPELSQINDWQNYQKYTYGDSGEGVAIDRYRFDALGTNEVTLIKLCDYTADNRNLRGVISSARSVGGSVSEPLVFEVSYGAKGGNAGRLTLSAHVGRADIISIRPVTFDHDGTTWIGIEVNGATAGVYPLSDWWFTGFYGGALELECIAASAATSITEYTETDAKTYHTEKHDFRQGASNNGVDFATENKVREKLTADRTYYVDGTSGSDSNDGLSSGAGAFATPQKAIDVASLIDPGAYQITTLVADGTYTSGIHFNGFASGASGSSFYPLKIEGNTTTPSNCVISTTDEDAVTCGMGARLEIRGFKSVTSGTYGSHFFTHHPGTFLTFGEWEFGSTATNYSHINPGSMSAILVDGDYTVSGGAYAHVYADASYIQYHPGLAVTMSGTPAFTTTVVSDHLGVVNFGTSIFSGSATGARYLAKMNGIIETNGGGASFIPGDVAGSTATGGQYA